MVGCHECLAFNRIRPNNLKRMALMPLNSRSKVKKLISQVELHSQIQYSWLE